MPFEVSNNPLLHPHLDSPQIGTLTHKSGTICLFNVTHHVNISTEVSKIPSVGGLIIIFNNHFAVKHWAFDIEKIKSYLSSDADTAHIGFAFSDLLGYTLYKWLVEQYLEFQGG